MMKPARFNLLISFLTFILSLSLTSTCVKASVAPPRHNEHNEVCGPANPRNIKSMDRSLFHEEKGGKDENVATKLSQLSQEPTAGETVTFKIIGPMNTCSYDLKPGTSVLPECDIKAKSATAGQGVPLLFILTLSKAGVLPDHPVAHVTISFTSGGRTLTCQRELGTTTHIETLLRDTTEAGWPYTAQPGLVTVNADVQASGGNISNRETPTRYLASVNVTVKPPGNSDKE